MVKPGSVMSSPLVGRVELAGDGVMEVFGAGVLEADVVGGPAGAECVALRRQLADEIREATVVRVTAGFEAQDCHRVGRCAFPVGEEVGRALGIEKDKPGRVRRPGRTGVHLGAEAVLTSRRRVYPRGK